MQRIEEKDVAAMIEASKKSLEKTSDRVPMTTDSSSDQKQGSINAGLDDFIAIEDFAKVEMKVAYVVACNHVEGADKLLQFT